MSPAGFPHSEILGSKSGYRLPEAYRRFPRPSSVPGAKASTVRPCKLETKFKPQRCSRPLYSSQHTTRPTPGKRSRHTHHPATAGRRGYGQHPGPRHSRRPGTTGPPCTHEGHRWGPIPQDPTTCQHHPRPHPGRPFHTHPHTRRQVVLGHRDRTPGTATEY